ncbi:MAG: sulfite exporter TauE/SafE family protein [Bacteroidia bacterium]|nr:sulfite exporter TauE/SafE family protein [Bacteroidia bacterium]MDW8332606.1 sulfite exporter TauE/SafE family protein [Bacteroidia bacterium]
MEVEVLIKLVVLGILTGLLSGAVGLGGGVIVIPGLVLLMGANQKLAQGTSLTMLAIPFAAVGAYNYYKAGNARLDWALILGLGMMTGSYFSSKWINRLPDLVRIPVFDLEVEHPVKKLFAVVMIVLGVYLFRK